MKRVFSILLAAVMMFTLLATGAFAGTEGYTLDSVDNTDYKGTVTYNATTKAYTASYTGADLVASNQYVFMVVKVDAANAITYKVSEDTIKYIDQGDGTGVSYTFIPNSVPECVVMLFGTFSDSTTSRVLGKLTAQGVTVTGSVSYLGTVTKPTVTLSNGTNTYTATVADPVSGTSTYSIESVPEGTYTLTITKSGHLRYSQTVTVGEENQIIPAAMLFGGDVDSDGGVTLSDLSSVLTAFGQSGTGIIIPGNDIDEDGGITLTDLSTTLTNFGK